MPGEPGERLGPRSRRLGEAAHLGEPARDERRLRVVPEPEPVGAARGERDHVLGRGAELDADDVVVDVDAERRRGDRELELHRERAILARDHGRGGQARARSPRRCSGRRARRPAGP